MAWMMAMTENTRPTAAVAWVEILPTKQVSAALYTAVTNMLMIVGIAKVVMSLGTGVCVM